MSENTTETIIGAVVLAVAGVFFYFAVASTDVGGSPGDDYVLTASFRSIEGVSVGTDVRMAGVKIGSVTKLDLDPVTYRAMAHLGLRADLPIPDDSAVLVTQEGLLGGVFVEIVPGGSLENLETGGEIRDTQGAVSLISLLLKFVSGSGSDG